MLAWLLLIGLFPGVYIYREREGEWGYGASRSTKSVVLRVYISNLKIQMADPNR
jgi:hypothetical protein